MRSKLATITVGAALLMITIAGGCSDSNPISAFQPEIINEADAFEFQITNAKNVTTILTYTWPNSGTQATVDHSTAVVGGAASIVLKDANGTQVYSSTLKASGTEQTITGVPGNWLVLVTFSDFDGTSNFRLQKL